jgi:O-acetylhomoserine/O-acetylserine sulfhydrylase-like pyridoxal-dependent enzyme
VFSSGMSAISAVMASFCESESANSKIIIGDELYCDTPKVAKSLSKNVVNLSDALMQIDYDKPANVLFVETCSNPTGIVPDYQKILGLAHFVCLDNTWLSGYNFNPFKTSFGDKIDVVIESMSKYVSGGQCIAGMCIAKVEHSNRIFNQIRLHGIHVPNSTCDIVLKALPTIPSRLDKSFLNTKRVLENIRGQHTTTSLYYPDLQQVSVSKTNGPSIFAIKIPFPNGLFSKSDLKRKVVKFKLREAIDDLCSKYQIPFETSFGSSYSKLDCYPSIIDLDAIRFRIYVGYAGDDLDRVVSLVKDLISMEWITA